MITEQCIELIIVYCDLTVSYYHYFVLLYCFSGITVPRRTSHVCLYNS